MRIPCLAVLVLLLAMGAASARTYRVDDADELRRVLRSLQAGETLEIAPGEYKAPFSAENLAGTKASPIVVRGADPDRRPVLVGGNTAFHLKDCSHVRLANLVVRGASHNGINIHDGGSIGTPAHHIVLENIEIREIGPRGNFDALKMSGVDGFRVLRCSFDGWGGQGIDLVGCHNGVIDGCHFQGREGFTQSAGIQLKGGTSRVVVKRSSFRDAGQRAINLGGSTGLPYFRPADADCEASEIEIAGNTFFGSTAPISWVGSVGGHVHHNTIVAPDKWVARILQESRQPRFKPCQKGRFEHNLVVFDARVRTFVNVGPGTEPESFVFEGNAWFERGGDRRPRLPVAEKNGIHGIDPKLEIEGNRAVVTSPSPRLRTVGAGAYRE